MTTNIPELPEWGSLIKGESSSKYLHARLDDNIIPIVSKEDMRALSDYPVIYIYISTKLEDGGCYLYIGQTINIFNRIRQHSEKIKGDKIDEKFEKFKNGDYFAFYGETIAQHLNYIEKLLISVFIQNFNFLNFVNLNKDKQYVSRSLANKTRGNDSGKYQKSREEIEKTAVNGILNLLKDKGVLNSNLKFNRVTSSLFAETPFFELTPNQNKIKDGILESAKRIHLIDGQAGTGKTVLLLHIIAAIKQKSPMPLLQYLFETLIGSDLKRYLINMD